MGEFMKNERRRIPKEGNKMLRRRAKRQRPQTKQSQVELMTS
jgi:hypothetical protein